VLVRPWPQAADERDDLDEERSMANTHITARIDRETAERLARRARVEDRSASSIVRLALRQYLAPRGARIHTPDDLKEVA
jgi:hypothetical protein